MPTLSNIIKKYDYYLIKWEFKIVFNDIQYCPYVMSEICSNKTMCFQYSFLEKVINDLKVEGYNCNHIAEMNITTIVSKRDMSYDFCIKHNLCALEWNLFAKINKSKILIHTFDRNWSHPLNRKIESYRAWSFNRMRKLTIKSYSNLSLKKYIII